MKKDELEPRYLLRSSGTLHAARYSRIVYLKAEGDYTRVFLKNGTSILTSIRLGEHAGRLDDHPHFFRCDRSYMVNVRYVTDVDKDGTVHLQHGGPIHVSGPNYQELLDRIPTR